MKIWRIILGVVGIGIGTYGISQLLTQIPRQTLALLAFWLIGALIIHNGLLSPAVVGVGAALRRYIPDRGRRYLQFGLIMAAMVTVIAVPMIYRAHTQPPAKALLLQDFAVNLTVLLAAIGGGTLIAYAIRVARDRSVPGRPPPDEAQE
ncbi:MAG TPA: hypothetical protein VJ301_19500 [Propionibacteriaceae bacterium]|jgi:hypothetical protein|nr:hypothetical protein [Propionibacteriaceae bacterium]